MTQEAELPRVLQAETSMSAKDRWLVLLAAFLGWGFDGLEQGIFPLISNSALMELAKKDKPLADMWNGYITAAWLLGAAAGGIAFGWLGDKLGRVRAMALSILAYSLFTGLGYFAQQPWHLAALRVMAALGMGGEWALGVALVMECWPEKWRPVLAGCIGAASNVGFLLIGLFAAFFSITPTSWRWVMLVGAAPAFLTFLIQLFVPESQRWKESVKHGASRPIREIFSSGLAKNTLLAMLFATVALIGTWAAVQQIPVWVDRQLAQGYPKAKAYAAIVTAVGAIIGCFFAPIIGGKIGRRPAYFGLCLGSLIFSSILFWKMSAFGPVFLGMVGIVGCFSAAFYGWLPLYLPELFPTRVRATGQGLAYNFGRVLTAGAAMSMGSIVAFYHGSYAHMAGTIVLVYVVGMVVIWFGPETKGKPLPE